MKKILVIGTLAASVMLAGCGGSSNYRTVSDEELDAYMLTVNGNEKYREYYRQILSGGDTDAVINFHGLAMQAWVNGDFEVAAAALDEEIRYIETVYADNPTAKKARSKFQNEAIKDFKGEPYERAMVFLKRGLLYLYDDEYENARAMFESGLLQDSLADDSEYIHDYASLEFLSGWASHCNGDSALAQESFDRVLALNSEIRIPEESDNHLIYRELGMGPEKVGKGEYKEMLTFQERLNYEQRQVKAIEYLVEDNADITAQLMEDIHWQATTRGGREIDMVNEGKAVFKEQSGEVAETMMDVASAATMTSMLTDNSDMANLGAASAIIGLASMFMSSKTKPAADLRSINTPGRIYLGTGSYQANDSRSKGQSFMVYNNGEKIKSLEWNDEYDFEQNRGSFSQKSYNSPSYQDFDGKNYVRAEVIQTIDRNQPLTVSVKDASGAEVSSYVFANTDRLFKIFEQFKAVSLNDESGQIENCAISF